MKVMECWKRKFGFSLMVVTMFLLALSLPGIVLAGNGDGTCTVSPASVNRGTATTLTFIYTAPTTAQDADGMAIGSQITITVPEGWTPPQGTAGTAGYTTASVTTGTATVTTSFSDRTVTVTTAGAALTEGHKITVTYGSGTGKAVAGTDNTKVKFTVQSKDGTAGTLTELTAGYPNVYLNGSGTCIVDKASVGIGSTGNTLTFTYTAQGTLKIGGKISITVPSGWTEPVTGNTTAVISTGGAAVSTSFSGRTATVTTAGADMANGDTITVTYANVTAGTTSPALFLVRSQMEPTGSLFPIEVSPTVALDGSGTNVVSPTSVGAGSTTTLTFTYTAAEQMTNGTLTIEVPADWSAPQGTSGTAGYTTATSTGAIGTISFSGTGPYTVTVPITSLANSQTITVVYGQGGGTSGAEVPEVSGSVTFTTRSKVVTSGNLTNLTVQPTVSITPADGGGTAYISPSSVTAGSTTNTLTITYEATSEVPINAGIRITVPGGWTTPQGTSSTSAGYTIVTLDYTDEDGTPDVDPSKVVSFSGMTITILIATEKIEPGERIIVVYGAGGGSAAATAQNTAGSASFPVESKVSAGGTFTVLKDGTPAPVTVTNAADGSGTATVLPTTAVKGSDGNSLKFEYKAIGTMNGGQIQIAIPTGDGWEAPTLTAPANVSVAYSSGASGTLGVGGSNIDVTALTLGPGGTITVTYGTADNKVIAGSTVDTSTFTVKSKGISALANIATSPTVTLSNLPDGSGTCVVDPANAVAGSTGNEFTFIFTSTGYMSSQISISMPTGWTPPQKTSGTVGYTTASYTKGTTTTNIILEDGAFSGQTVTVEIPVALVANDKVTVKYGSGGGASGVTAPGATGAQTFVVRQKSSAAGTLAPIAQSPAVSLTTPDGSGTIISTVTTGTIYAGSTENTITFAFKAATTMNGGAISITAPPGWSAPQGTSGTAGYTTATTTEGIIGTPAFSDQTVTVPLTQLSNTQTVTVTYGNGGGASGAVAQGAAGTVTFVVKSKASDTGALKTIAANPSVSVINAKDGSGACMVSPMSVIKSSTGNTLTFTYMPVGTMNGGLLTIDIHDDWTDPQLTNASAAGYTVVSSTGTISFPSITGTLATGADVISSIGDDVINVPIVSLEKGQTITVTYGSGGGASGVTAPTETGDYEFAVSTSGSAGGTLTPFATDTSPKVTVATAQPPAIAHIPVSTSPVNTAIAISAEVSDDGTVASVTLLYRAGGISFDTNVGMTNTVDTTYTATIPASAVTNTGLSYRIMAVDNVGMSSSTARYNVTVTGASVTLPAGTLPVWEDVSPSKYRMVSVPIEGGPNSTTLFSPFGAGTWDGWYFTGVAGNNGYQHLTDIQINHNPGIAAWVGTINPQNALTVTNTPASTTASYSVPLNSGWNQIACPFNFKRYWNEATIKVGLSNNIASAVNINTASSVTPPYPWVQNFIYWWTPADAVAYDYGFASSDQTIPNQTVSSSSWRGAGDFEGEPTGKNWPGTLDPWGGYWIYAYVDCYLFVDPTTPGPGSTPQPLEADEAAPAFSPLSWSVQLSAESGNAVDARNFAGIVQDAENGVDKYDVKEAPRAPGSLVQLSFPHADWDIMSGNYMQDMVQPADEMIWDAQAKAAGNLPVVIRWDASAVPMEYRTVLLIDTATDARINLREVTAYTYTPSSSDVRQFKLIVSKALPEKYAAIPTKSELLQNYPNPFNPETWIPFKVSKAADVTIKIYNISGQLVRSLNLGQLEPGSYLTKERAAYWNGRSDNGEKVASGIYLYYIKAGSFSSTKKMVVLK